MKRIPDMIKAERISVEEAYRRVQSKDALLVCGYNDEEIHDYAMRRGGFLQCI
jgi:hypothetical protein